MSSGLETRPPTSKVGAEALVADGPTKDRRQSELNGWSAAAPGGEERVLLRQWNEEKDDAAEAAEAVG